MTLPTTMRVLKPSRATRIVVGDARDALRCMRAESVHMIACSPPYFGLRSYDADPSIWQDDVDCDHDWNKQGFCRDRCGAWRGCLGLEPTPEQYCRNMVEIFREARRVLRDDGTCWIVIGDSYAATGKSGGGAQGERWKKCGGDTKGSRGGKWSPAPPGFKPKDLIGIPWMTAFALRADGWWLRQDVIWQKPNSLPEPVRDRCTRSHEYVFMLTKSANYYYDQDAIREPHESKWYDGSAPWREGRAKQQQRGDSYHPYKDAVPFSNRPNPAGRNKRSVWNISTRGVKDAHFAVYPMELVQPMIKAGTSEKGCCRECGAPWTRIVERKVPDDERRSKGAKLSQANTGLRSGSLYERTPKRKLGQAYQDQLDANPPRTVDWKPGCDCGADVFPCTVLDPFCGSGTTLVAARRLACHAIGIELNPEYARIARDRIRKDVSFQLSAAFPQKGRY